MSIIYQEYINSISMMTIEIWRRVSSGFAPAGLWKNQLGSYLFQNGFHWDTFIGLFFHVWMGTYFWNLLIHLRFPVIFSVKLYNSVNLGMRWAAGEERSLGQCAEASSCCPCRALRGALRIGPFPMPRAKEGGSLKNFWKTRWCHV